MAESAQSIVQRFVDGEIDRDEAGYGSRFGDGLFGGSRAC